jgi:hypothetical protein
MAAHIASVLRKEEDENEEVVAKAMLELAPDVTERARAAGLVAELVAELETERTRAAGLAAELETERARAAELETERARAAGLVAGLETERAKAAELETKMAAELAEVRLQHHRAMTLKTCSEMILQSKLFFCKREGHSTT